MEEVKPIHQEKQYQMKNKELSCEQLPSDKANLYAQIIGHHIRQAAKQDQYQLRLLKQGRVEVDRIEFYEHFTAELVNSTDNFQVLSFEAVFGHFKMPIVALNVDQVSWSHRFPSNFSSFAHVYHIPHKQVKKRAAVKCFRVENQNDFEQIFKNVFKQYCLLKIASILKIGPKCRDLFGFDLVVFDDCIQFSMEQCDHLDRIDTFEIEVLKQKMAIMHSLGIVHLDIKPLNLLISPAFNEPVFIDFGFSDCVKQKIGNKSATLFRGSLSYCSTEMMQAFRDEKLSFVDKFYNDAVGLDKSFEQLTSFTEEYEDEESEDGKSELYNEISEYLKEYASHNEDLQLFDLIRLKFQLFHHQEIMTEITSQFVTKHFDSLMNFIGLLSYSMKLEQTRRKLIERGQKGRDQGRFYSGLGNTPKIARNIDAQPKKSKEQQYQSTSFEDRFSPLFEEVPDQPSSPSNDFTFIKKKDYSWLLDPQLIQKKHTLTYIRGYINFVNFSSCLSSIQQKIQVSDVMIAFLTIDEDKVASKYKSFQICLRFILEKFLKTQETYFQEIIPITFKSLIVLDCFNYESIRDICQRIMFFNPGDFKVSILKLRMKSAITWAWERGFKSSNIITQDQLGLISSMLNSDNSSNCLQASLNKIEKEVYSSIQRKSLIDETLIQKEFQILSITKSTIQQLFLTILFSSKKAKHCTNDFAFNYRMQAIEDYQKCTNYSIVFDFYYFLFMEDDRFRALFAHKTFPKMLRCLEDIELIKKFRLFLQGERQYVRNASTEIKLKFHVQNILNSYSIEELLLMILREENREMVLFHYEDIIHSIQSLYFYCYAGKIEKEEDQIRVLQLLKQQIKPNIFQIVNFRSFSLKNQKIINGLCDCYYKIQKTFIRLYKNQQYCFGQLDNFFNAITRSILLKDLSESKLKFPLQLMRFQMVYLLQFDQFQLAIETSLVLIKMTRFKTATVSDYLSLIEQIMKLIYISNSSGCMQNIKRSEEMLYTTILQGSSNYLSFVFASVDSIHCLRALNKCTLVHWHSAEHFMDLHAKISCFLKNTFNLQQTQQYLQLLNILKNVFRKEILQLWKQIKQSEIYKSKLYFQNQYMLPLYSQFLMAEKTMNKHVTHISLMICKQGKYLNRPARYFVLEKLYYFYFKRSQCSQNKRYKRHLFNESIKYRSKQVKNALFVKQGVVFSKQFKKQNKLQSVDDKIKSVLLNKGYKKLEMA